MIPLDVTHTCVHIWYVRAGVFTETFCTTSAEPARSWWRYVYITIAILLYSVLCTAAVSGIINCLLRGWTTGRTSTICSEFGDPNHGGLPPAEGTLGTAYSCCYTQLYSYLPFVRTYPMTRPYPLRSPGHDVLHGGRGWLVVKPPLPKYECALGTAVALDCWWWCLAGAAGNSWNEKISRLLRPVCCVPNNSWRFSAATLCDHHYWSLLYIEHNTAVCEWIVHNSM